MRILITNDDGINAPGLALAEEVAASLAGPEGEVWVVAPDRERSGVSHAISYTSPMRIVEYAPRRFGVDGFPADCTMVGLRKLMADTPPDLVLSGINRGHNVAEDVFYSGTVGGAMEGALQGLRAVALSQFFRIGADDAPDDIWEPARHFALATLRRVLQMPFPPGIFYNVNFPARRSDAVQGTTICPQGIRRDATFEVVSHMAPNGRVYEFLKHRVANQSAPEGSDARQCLDGWITITPLRAELTANDLIAEADSILRRTEPG